MKKVAEQINKILDTCEIAREELEGSAVIDEIENAIWEIADKYKIKLKANKN